MTRVCWCGRSDLAPFGPDYLACGCGTLVRATMPAGDITRVADEDRDLYGKNYWYARQAELGLPDIDARRQSDLHDRHLAWLRTVLSCKTPPARVLEIGAAHGGFVALLTEAGFDAVGLEVSPWVAEYAKRFSGVRMHTGPLEDQPFERRSFDLILAFDVLEHLPDPLGTLRRCEELLRDDGAIVIQTPLRNSDLEYERLLATRFREMLLAEHLHLFSDASVREILARAGLPGVRREAPVFDTDMMLVAGRREPAKLDVSNGRVPPRIEMLLRLDGAWRGRQKALESRLAESDRDRVARESQIAKLDRWFAQADRDRIERQRQVDELGGLFAQADRDRVDRQRQIDDLQGRFAEADRDRTERQRQIEELSGLFAQADADRAGRQRQIDDLERRIADLEQRHRQTIEELDRTQEAERQERRARMSLLEGDLARLSERYESLRAVMTDHRNSRVYQAMVRSGRWRPFDAWLLSALDAPPPERRSATARQDLERVWTMQPAAAANGDGAIAVDLTALVAGGENGGAKIVALELVRAMARLAPDRQFLLLTSAASHYDVAGLEAPNVRRMAVDPGPATLSGVLDREPISVLFCPMTGAPFDDPRVPVVSLVHDLQYRTYPEFFDEGQRNDRHAAFERTGRLADHVIVPSEYVRASVLSHSAAAGASVTAIPHGFAGRRLARPSDRDVAEALHRYGLTRGQYFIYPANFWPHKNHLMLLVAFGQLCHRHPALDLRLVLTGAASPEAHSVREGVQRMGLGHRVVMPGYVADVEIAALLTGALALVFPSLYEGFGMPIVEAFAAGCAVACSRVTSLPEVAGDAALYFDPRKPDEIADALERLAQCPAVVADLQRRGFARLAELPDADGVAAAYLHAIERVRLTRRRPKNQLAGIFSDRWTTSLLVIEHDEAASEVRLELDNSRDIPVTLAADGVEPIVLDPQRTLALRCMLPGTAGHFGIAIDPTFKPIDRGFSADTRSLGVRLRACTVVSPSRDPIDLLAGIALG